MLTCPTVGLLASTDDKSPPFWQVKLLDGNAGTYAFDLVDTDGITKSIVYHRPDMVAVTVSASRIKSEHGDDYFRYELQNDETSGQFLSGFVLQYFSESAQPIQRDNAYVGQMGKHLPDFSQGSWIRWGQNIFGEEVVPGSNVVVALASEAHAEIVECKVHSGSPGIVGIGSELPPELADQLPGYEAWPSGHTIGPSDNELLRTLRGRVAYLLSNLELVSSLGWLHASELEKYQSLLSSNPSEESLRKIVSEDAQKRLITSEITALLDF